MKIASAEWQQCRLTVDRVYYTVTTGHQLVNSPTAVCDVLTKTSLLSLVEYYLENKEGGGGAAVHGSINDLTDMSALLFHVLTVITFLSFT